MIKEIRLGKFHRFVFSVICMFGITACADGGTKCLWSGEDMKQIDIELGKSSPVPLKIPEVFINNHIISINQSGKKVRRSVLLKAVIDDFSPTSEEIKQPLQSHLVSIRLLNILSGDWDVYEHRYERVREVKPSLSDAVTKDAQLLNLRIMRETDQEVRYASIDENGDVADWIECMRNEHQEIEGCGHWLRNDDLDIKLEYSYSNLSDWRTHRRNALDLAECLVVSSE